MQSSETTLTPQEEQRFHELCLMAFGYARENDVKNLKIMLDAGLNINLETHKGDTLLMLASYHNAFESAKLLLERGAEVDRVNHRGQTPLAGVCFKGHFEMAKLLVSYGADIDRNNGMGMTPYGFAVMFGHYDLAKFLHSQSKPSFFKSKALKLLGWMKRCLSLRGLKVF
ncbi:ankyrin repeat domain-containing protein [Helicobacter pametensis]|uniref:ankyrin repeat domain-containing protein n=1 Tax=Helicobacter pametensis TaxID=95149 RepID=UPI0004850C16|nr:ankyrin repeat domain-containing protein [Helicobacter pametensis]